VVLSVSILVLLPDWRLVVLVVLLTPGVRIPELFKLKDKLLKVNTLTRPYSFRNDSSSTTTIKKGS